MEDGYCTVTGKMNPILLLLLLLSPGVANLSQPLNGYLHWSPDVDLCPAGVKVPDLPQHTCSTCRGRCGYTPPPTRPHLLQCSCDHLCRAHGDCCPDFHTHCPRDYSRGHVGGDGHASCHQIPTSMRTDGSMMYETYRLVDIRYKTGQPCERDSAENLHLPHLAVPVRDRDSGISYVNFQCAVSNGATNIQPFNVSIQCEHNNTEINEIAKMEDLELLLSEDTCWVQYEEHMTRSGCDTMVKVISDCPETCNNTELVAKCRGPIKDVVCNLDNLQYIYKNIYCAYCNEAVKARVDCAITDVLNTYFPGYGMGYAQVKLAAFSLSVLFDFSPGSRTGVVENPCTVDQIFIPETKSCHELQCPDDHFLHQGSCYPRQINITKVITLTFNDTENLQILLTAFTDLAQMLVMQDEIQLDIFTAMESESVSDALIILDGVTNIGLELNISLIIILELNSNFSGDVDLELRVYDDRITSKLTLSMLNIITEGGVDLTSVSLTINGQNLYSSQLKQDCTWILYKTRDFTVLNGTLRLLNVSYPTGRYTVLEEDQFLLCVSEESQPPGVYSPVSLSPALLGLLTIVCLSLSLLCLSVRIIAHCFVPYFRTPAGLLQLQLCVALFLSFSSVLAGGAVAYTAAPLVACVALAMVKYVAFLAAFFWMMILAMDAYLTFRPSSHFSQNSERSRKFWIYSAVCWISPVLLLAITVSAEYIEAVPTMFKPGFGTKTCWFNERYGLLIYFGGPVICLLLLSSCFFSLTLCHIHRAMKGSKKLTPKRTSRHGEVHHALIYLRLSVIMGVTWVFGFVATFLRNDVMWIVFIVLNGLQGVFIFIGFVCRKKVIQDILKTRRMTSLTKSTPATYSVTDTPYRPAAELPGETTHVPSPHLTKDTPTSATPVGGRGWLGVGSGITGSVGTLGGGSTGFSISSVCTVEQTHGVYVDSDEIQDWSLKDNVSSSIISNNNYRPSNISNHSSNHSSNNSLNNNNRTINNSGNDISNNSSSNKQVIGQGQARSGEEDDVILVQHTRL